MSNTMKVTTHYPYSEEFEWETQMVDINLDEERIRDISEGKGFIVKSPKPIKDDLKDPDGIFSTKFGATLQDMRAYQERYRCRCGHTMSRLMISEECPICHTKVKFVDDDFGFFGWCVLKEPYHVIHPSLYTSLCKFIDAGTFNDIITFSKYIDKDGNVVERKPTKNEPFFGIGMMEFYDRYEEIIEYYHEKNKKSAVKMEYYEVLMNAGKSKVFTRSIPVFTTLLRPYRVDGTDLHFESTNSIFKIMATLTAAINNDTNTIDRKGIIQNKLLKDAQDKIKELYDEIGKILSGKRGQIRQLYGGRFNFSSRSVIVPNNRVAIDEIELSYQCLCGLLQQVIINILHKSYNMSYNDAHVYWDRHRIYQDPVITRIIEGLINARKKEGKRGLPIIINRNPTISFGGIVGVYCVGISAGYTMGISLQILKGLAADFDGVAERQSRLVG